MFFEGFVYLHNDSTIFKHILFLVVYPFFFFFFFFLLSSFFPVSLLFPPPFFFLISPSFLLFLIFSFSQFASFPQFGLPFPKSAAPVLPHFLLPWLIGHSFWLKFKIYTSIHIKTKHLRLLMSCNNNNNNNNKWGGGRKEKTAINVTRVSKLNYHPDSSPGGTDLERGMGMCGPEDPLFTPLLPLARVPFQAKESVHKTPFWKNLEILASTASIFTQILARKPPNLEFSAHKPPNLEVSRSQAPLFRGKCQFASPTLRKSGPHTPTWKKLSAPPGFKGDLRVIQVTRVSKLTSWFKGDSRYKGE